MPAYLAINLLCYLEAQDLINDAQFYALQQGRKRSIVRYYHDLKERTMLKKGSINEVLYQALRTYAIDKGVVC